MKPVMISVLAMLCLAASCSGATEVGSPESLAADNPTSESSPQVEPDDENLESENQAPSTPERTAPEPDSPDAGSPEPALPDPTAPTPEPVPYIPAGQPGTAQDYVDMIERLEPLVPAELRDQAPWPDLRNPNPIVAQVEIFELWIWMAEFVTEPELVEIMAAPGSPSRNAVVSIFGELESENVFERRTQQPYQAFDHVVVTFESAGLPLWLSRDVPDDAVVVYYSDSSGPVEIIDQDTGQIVALNGGIGTRSWLSIMVPTDVGWQLWRDQLLDPSNPELQMPDVPAPSTAEDTRQPEV